MRVILVNKVIRCPDSQDRTLSILLMVKPRATKDFKTYTSKENCNIQRFLVMIIITVVDLSWTKYLIYNWPQRMSYLKCYQVIFLSHNYDLKMSFTVCQLLPSSVTLANVALQQLQKYKQPCLES